MPYLRNFYIFVDYLNTENWHLFHAYSEYPNQNDQNITKMFPILPDVQIYFWGELGSPFPGLPLVLPQNTLRWAVLSECMMQFMLPDVAVYHGFPIRKLVRNPWLQEFSFAPFGCFPVVLGRAHLTSGLRQFQGVQGMIRGSPGRYRVLRKLGGTPPSHCRVLGLLV